MRERWRPVAGFKGRYSVSSLGRVRSETRFVLGRYGLIRLGSRLLKAGIGKNGYPVASLWKGNVGASAYVHRLVLEAFAAKPRWAQTANHVDGIKTNNDISNLEWTTYAGNNLHAWSTGLQKRFKLTRLFCRKGHRRTASTSYVSPAGGIQCVPCKKGYWKTYKRRK